MDEKHTQFVAAGAPQSTTLSPPPTPSSSKLGSHEPPPLVIVEGFLSSAGAVLWGDFERHLNSSGAVRRTLFVSVGPVSSLHDRACELFYALKGGTVDYGEQHATLHAHNRYGRRIGVGSYPQWSRDRPLHFLGHSIGGSTIIKMQWLLKQGFFGPDYGPDMLLSVNTISSPFRGTQLVYTLGERTDGAPAVRPLSIGALLAKGVHVASYLSPFLPHFFDLQTEARSLSCYETSLVSLLKQLWRSDWAEGRDATPFDVTFEAAEEREVMGEGETHPRTFYRSHVACMTQSSASGPWHAPNLGHVVNAPLYLTSRLMGAFDFTALRPPPAFVSPATVALPSSPTDAGCGYACPGSDVEQGLPSSSERGQPCIGEEYWANDGVVPLFSQWHPGDCSPSRCRHNPIAKEAAATASPEPGVWHVHSIDDATHMSVVPVWFGSAVQKSYWRDIGCWLSSIDRRTREQV